MTQHDAGKALHIAFKSLGFSSGAIDYLLGIFHAISYFDDIKDGGAPEITTETAVERILILNSSSEFFWQHGRALEPIILTQALKWAAANYAEANGRASEKSFMWRAGFYDLALAVAYLDGVATIDNGAVLEQILCIYGENLQDYFAEFDGGKNA